MLQEQIDASFYFSDEFQPQLDSEGPMRYIRPDASHFELKNCGAEIIHPSCF